MQLIMEFLPLGSLREYLPKRKQGILQVLMLSQQICEVSIGGFVVLKNTNDLFSHLFLQLDRTVA